MPLKVIRGKNKESYRCTADNGVGNPLTKGCHCQYSVWVRVIIIVMDTDTHCIGQTSDRATDKSWGWTKHNLLT